MTEFIRKLFSLKSQPAPENYKLQSTQDAAKKNVIQTIHDEIVKFNYSDFHDLKNNEYYDRFFAGQLSLPTGLLVCTDPMYREFALPQSSSIAKGQYPVYLYIGLEDDFAGRIAYAELVIKEMLPDYWEMSLIPGHLLTNNLAQKINGMYPVENGLSCFADFETFEIYEQEINDFYLHNPEGNFYLDVLQQHFKANANIPASSRGEDWINYKPAKATGNIIMFGSGYGDGLYARYAGYDAKGNMVKFVTDFIQLDSTLKP